MPVELTQKHIKRFEKICNDMASLIEELHKGGHPDAVVYLEDGTPVLYADWPADLDRHPAVAEAYGAYWHKSGGGGL